MAQDVSIRPGPYLLYAIVNYTYQRDVAVKGDEDRPENPDVFYWYDSLSQTIPLTYRDDRSDSENAYLRIEPVSTSRTLAAVPILIVLASALIVVVKKRGKS